MRFSLDVAHPWHGIEPGIDPPRLITAFIEIVPLDTVKYEIDKKSGHLKVDRPQKFSSLCPTPYGFIPRTYCDERIADLARRDGRKVERGDKDPLDICVLTEHTLPRSGILLSAKPIGGFRLLDKGEADDKIIAVLEGDPVFGSATDISDIPAGLLDRLRHYFLTYKEIPGESGARRVEISDVYGVSGAHEVITQSMEDYRSVFSGQL